MNQNWLINNKHVYNNDKWVYYTCHKKNMHK